MKDSFKKGAVVGLLGATILGVSTITDKQNVSLVHADVDDEVASSTVLSQNSALGPGYYSNSASRAMFSSRMATDTQGFIDSVSAGALSGWNKYGVLPSVSIAQSILESGWGKSDLSTVANNLFGIKGTYQGQSVLMPTQEYLNGQWTTVNAQFRKYPSWSASIEDHGYFLYANSRYANLLGVKDYQTVTRLLQEDGYATAPTYASSLNQIIEQYNLVKYDQSVVSVHLGCLDELSYSKDVITARGWHADNASANYPYSFLILTDVDTGKEYKKIPISRATRSDVAQAYPDVTNSLSSGFNESIPVTNAMHGHTYKITSRYSTTADGSGASLDYGFDQTISIPKLGNENKASLDNFNISGTGVDIKGWHAADQADGRNYHFIFLMDAATNTELKRISVTNTSRPDVGAAYPAIFNSNNSGFKTNMTTIPAWWGKKVYVKSRYSANSTGNSDYIDYDFSQQTLTVPQPQENKAWLDEFSIINGEINVKGWHASDLAYGRTTHTLILMNADTNKELERRQVVNTTRTDVKNAYPNLYNAEQSGFKTVFSNDEKLSGKRIYLISRYSNPAGSATDYVDYKFDKEIIKVPQNFENKGSLDLISQNGANLTLKGWHAADLAKNRNYRYLFIMDKATNTELKRVKITSVARADVEQAYPSLYGAGNSGFLLTIPTNGLAGKSVYVMTRYTSDSTGTRDYVDYSFSGQTFTIR